MRPYEVPGESLYPNPCCNRVRPQPLVFYAKQVGAKLEEGWGLIGPQIAPQVRVLPPAPSMLAGESVALTRIPTALQWDEVGKPAASAIYATMPAHTPH